MFCMSYITLHDSEEFFQLILKRKTVQFWDCENLEIKYDPCMTSKNSYKPYMTKYMTKMTKYEINESCMIGDPRDAK